MKCVDCPYFWTDDYDNHYPTCHYQWNDGYAPCEVSEEQEPDEPTMDDMYDLCYGEDDE